MAIVRSTQRLRELIGTPSDLVRLKIHRKLNAAARNFIAQSPMAFVATCTKTGLSQISPKGDAPGFAQIENDETLVIPERKGNKLAFTLENVLANPGIGLIFVVPGTPETLRVEGVAELDDDPQQCQEMSARGSPALLLLRIRIDSVYFHCAKSFLRAQLWRHDTWPQRVEISFGNEIAQGGGLRNQQIEAFDAAVQSRYESDL